MRILWKYMWPGLAVLAAALALTPVVPVSTPTPRTSGLRGPSRDQQSVEDGLESQAAESQAARGGTYRLVDRDGNVVRTGRSCELARREREHARDPVYGKYEFRVDKRTDIYDRQRGREQIIHEKYKPPLNFREPVRPEDRDRFVREGRKLGR